MSTRHYFFSPTKKICENWKLVQIFCIDVFLQCVTCHRKPLVYDVSVQNDANRIIFVACHHDDTFHLSHWVLFPTKAYPNYHYYFIIYFSCHMYMMYPRVPIPIRKTGSWWRLIPEPTFSIPDHILSTLFRANVAWKI